MEATATTDNALTLPAFELEPTPTHKKDQILLAKIPMPDSPNQKEGTRNELEVCVRYIKDGMGRAGGRGVFLTLNGQTIDGPFKSFLLYQDPSHYIQIEPAKRFSRKTLEKVARQACETHRDKIEEIAEQARAYYRGKTMAH